MAPLLHVMRHGQGEHSAEVNKNGAQIRDAPLTEKGKQQCAKARAEFKRHDMVELLLASPLTRAIQTCLIAFEPCLERGLQIVALPIAEEALGDPCDTGSPLDVLKQRFPDHVDFEYMKYGWYKHEGEFALDPKSLLARAAKLRRFIRDRPEKEVVLVAHGFINHYIAGEVNEDGEQTTRWWNETEIRTYTFVDEGEEAIIKETDESVLRRGAIKNGLIINHPGKKNDVKTPHAR